MSWDREAAIGVAGAAMLLVGMLAAVAYESNLDDYEKPAADDPAAGVLLALLPEPEYLEFQVELAEASVVVAASAWVPADATVAITLVHGFSGSRDNFFHTLPEAGSSFGARLAMTGRAVFALDMPGYGDSPGLRTGGPIEAGDGILRMAQVLDAVADQLRSGESPVGRPFDVVIGSGSSMGSMVTDTAQGQHGSFDAIMPGGVSHRGARFCVTGPPVCPEAPQDDFWLPNADPDVVAATVAGYEAPHVLNLADIAVWVGACHELPVGLSLSSSCPRPTPWDLAVQPVDVPVLSYTGDRDGYFDTSDPAGEAAFYPNSPEVTVLHYAEVGHVVHNHLIQPRLVADIDAWLAVHGW